MESWLKSIWSDLLNVELEIISRDSNFFELGGDSLLGVRLITEIRKYYNRPEILNSYTIFRFPRFSDLVTAISSELDEPKDENFLRIGHESRLSRQKPFPLSFAQEQLWLHQEENSASNWNVIRLIQFKNQINLEALQGALNQILKENDSLRIIFITHGNKTWQRINSFKRSQINILDDLDVNALAMTLRSMTLDLSAGPLISFHMTKSTVNQVFICYHHILMDGHGWMTFLERLDALYEKFDLNSNVTRDLNTLSVTHNGNQISLAEAISWEKYQLQLQKCIDSLNYWKEVLKGTCAVKLTDVGTVPSTQGAGAANHLYNVQLPQELSERLVRLAQSESTTLMAVMFAIFKILTWRYTKDVDQTILTLFRSGNSREGAQLLMSHFVNLLPIRTELNPIKTFSEFLATVSKKLSQGLEHSGVPYQTMMNSLPQIDRTTKLQLLKIMFQMRALQKGPLTSIEEIHLPKQGAAVVDLGIDIDRNDPSTLLISFEYNPRIFSTSFVQRFASYYIELCTSAIEYARSPNVSFLNMLPEIERPKILNRFSVGPRMTWPQGTLTSLFQKQVEVNPHKLCVKDSSTAYTYEEVDMLSDRIAAHLCKMASSNSYIGVLLPRSANFLLSVLGILKAKKTIFPISLTHPENCMRAMLEDLAEPFVLTNRENLPKISSFHKRTIIMENVLEEPSEKNTLINLNTTVHVPAYVFFTSGTTGVPKGVIVKEDAILNVAWTYVTKMNLGPCDCSLFFHNPGFDASIADYWPSLISGGSITIPDETLSYDPAKLWDFLIQNKISYANLPTSVAKHVFTNFEKIQTPRLHSSQDCDSQDSSLRWLALGGEALKIAPPPQFPAKCLNGYGPTETTVDATHAIASNESVAKNSIGRPLPNVQTYILDDLMNLVPIGVVGTLWIGGRGLSEGYLNRNDLNTKVFKENPFIPGENIYCSGDAAAWLEDGSISILGRIDAQIKINGYRIELEGIETVVQSHPEISQAAVIYLPDSQFVIAYYVPHLPGFMIEYADLLSFVKRKLPHYTIPKNFISISQIPLTSSQKVNRKELQQFYENYLAIQTLKSTDLNTDIIIELTDTEALVAQVWASVFEIDVSTLEKTTTFYDVGGSSVMVGLLIRKLNIALELQNSKPLPLQFKDIFEHPTLESMSRMIDAKRNEVELYQNFLTSYQRYIWFHQELELGNEHPMYRRHRAFLIDEILDLDLLKRRVGHILKSFERFLCIQLQVVQGHLTVKRYPWTEFEKHQFIVKKFGNDLKYSLVEEMCLAFDLFGGRNPLFRSQIVTTHNSKYLCFFWHHIIVSYETYVSMFTEIENIEGLSSPRSTDQGQIEPFDSSNDLNGNSGFNVQVMRQPIGSSTDVFTTIADMLNNLELDLSKSVILVLDGTNSSLIPVQELIAAVSSNKESIQLSQLQEPMNEEDIFQKIGNSHHRIVIRILEECLEPTVMATGITSPLVLSATQAYLSADFDFYVKVFPHNFLEIEYNSDKFEIYGNRLRVKSITPNPKFNKPVFPATDSLWFNIISKLWSLSLEIPLTGIWAQKNVPFLNLGGSSNQFLEIYTVLSSLLDSHYLPLKEFYYNSSLQAAVHLLTKIQACPATGPESPVPILLESDVTNFSNQIRPSLNLVPYEHKTTDRVVLLTGSTGYLGVFILENLIKDSTIKIIYCLVRGNPGKVLENLKKYGILLKKLPPKVVPIVGDLTKEKLGLDAKIYNTMVQEVDCIIHSGAAVNLIQTYLQLRSTNVIGTKQLCQLAITGKGKAVHYLSTTETALSQFLFEQTDQLLEEKISCPPYFDMGYIQSKWVAECLVKHASQFVPARIYRVGTGGVHSTRSYPLPESFDGVFLGACTKLKSYPMMNGYTIPYSDVDYIADVITILATSQLPQSTENLIVNVVQKNYSLSEVLEINSNQTGTQFVMEDPAQWYAKLKEHAQQSTYGVLDKPLLLLEQKPWGKLSRMDLFEFSVRSPFISYPNETCELLCRSLIKGYVLPNPSIQKYLLH